MECDSFFAIGRECYSERIMSDPYQFTGRGKKSSAGKNCAAIGFDNSRGIAGGYSQYLNLSICATGYTGSGKNQQQGEANIKIHTLNIAIQINNKYSGILLFP
jgi:hypothetical protein